MYSYDFTDFSIGRVIISVIMYRKVYNTIIIGLKLERF